ncbi:hypothetical protein [Flexibacterium corallicola]|uniref:hypothetical protein n=1 Tax=Flexibacterium corallicola TaxID=3037259 RepID=UPI00286F75B6|nr:hypothetical protein [Pseudovibrio sp. M1P-2-3]
MHAFRDEGAVLLDGVEAEYLEGSHPPISKYDLTVDINPCTSGVILSMEYATDVFDEDTVHRLGAMLQRFFFALQTPDTPVALLQLLDGAEREQLLHGFNDTHVSYPEIKRLWSCLKRKPAYGLTLLRWWMGNTS